MRSFSKLLAIIFLIYGIIITIVAVLILTSTGLVEYGKYLGAKLGEDITEDYPTVFAIIGSIFILMLGILYFLSGTALFKLKKSASIRVILLGLVGVGTCVYFLITGGAFYYLELIWGVIFMLFGLYIRTRSDIFSN